MTKTSPSATNGFNIVGCKAPGFAPHEIVAGVNKKKQRKGAAFDAGVKKDEATIPPPPKKKAQPDNQTKPKYPKIAAE